METKRMLTNSWQENLRQILKRLKQDNPFPRVGIVGIGSDLRGDDAVGPFLVRRLAAILQESETRLMVDAGPAPENYTGTLRRFGPDLVILMDAAEMKQAPGSIQLIPWQDSIGLSASTHSLPLHLFAKYLEQELKCEIVLLGIQPFNIGIDAKLHDALRISAENAALDIATLLSKPTCCTKPLVELPNPNAKSSNASRRLQHEEHIRS
jgi:hydrogenase 3 maturation protease